MTKILTNALRAKLLENGQAKRAAIRNGSDDPQQIDPYPVEKIFTPDANATWLLTELDPEEVDLTFGLCDLGLGEPKLGYVRISEPQALRGPLRLPVERDLHFTATRPISHVLRGFYTGLGHLPATYSDANFLHMSAAASTGQQSATDSLRTKPARGRCLTRRNPG